MSKHNKLFTKIILVFVSVIFFGFATALPTFASVFSTTTDTYSGPNGSANPTSNKTLYLSEPVDIAAKRNTSEQGINICANVNGGGPCVPLKYEGYGYDDLTKYSNIIPQVRSFYFRGDYINRFQVILYDGIKFSGNSQLFSSDQQSLPAFLDGKVKSIQVLSGVMNKPSNLQPANGSVIVASNIVTLYSPMPADFHWFQVWGPSDCNLSTNWVPSNYYNLENLRVGETYYWRVMTKSAEGQSVWSDTYQFTMKPGGPWMSRFISNNILDMTYAKDFVYTSDSGTNKVYRTRLLDGTLMKSSGTLGLVNRLFNDGNFIYSSDAAASNYNKLSYLNLTTTNQAVDIKSIADGLFAAGKIWFSSKLDGTISAYSSVDNSKVCTNKIGSTHSGLYYNGSVIFAPDDGVNTVRKIDPATCQETADSPIKLNNKIAVLKKGISFANNNLYIIEQNSMLAKIDMATNQITEAPIGSSLNTLTFDGSTLWASDSTGAKIYRVNPADLTTIESFTSNSTDSLLPTGGYLYASSNKAGNLDRFAYSKIDSKLQSTGSASLKVATASVSASLSKSDGTINCVDINKGYISKNLKLNVSGNSSVTTGDGRVFVAGVDNKVYVVSCTAGTLISSFDVSAGTSVLALDNYNNLLYVLTSGTTSSLKTYSTVDYSQKSSLTLGNNASSLAVSREGSFVYVTETNDNALAIIDADTLSVRTRITLATPVDVIATPERIYVATAPADQTIWNSAVSVINAKTLTHIKNISLGGNAQSLAISADGKHLFVVMRDQNQLVSVSTDNFIREYSFNVSNPLTVSVNATSGIVWVVSGADKKLYALSPYNLWVISSLAVTDPSISNRLVSNYTLNEANLQAANINNAVSIEQKMPMKSSATVTNTIAYQNYAAMDDKFGFTSSYTSADVAKVDLSTGTVVKIRMPSNVYSMAVLNGYLYAVLRDRNSIAKVRISDNTLTAEYPIGAAPYYIKALNNKLWLAYWGGSTFAAGGSLAAIDPNSGVITCSTTGYGLIYQMNTDGKFIYTNDRSVAAGNVIRRFSSTDCSRSSDITLGYDTNWGTEGMSFDGKYLWVTQYVGTTGYIARIDTTTGLVKDYIKTSTVAFMLGFDGATMWVFDGNTGVNRIDVNTLGLVESSQIQPGASRVAVNGNKLLVSHTFQALSTTTIFSLSANTPPSKDLNVNDAVGPILTASAQNMSGALYQAGVVMDENYVYSTGFYENVIYKNRISDGTLVAKIPTGLNPVALVYQDNYLYVVNYSANSVTKINPNDGTVVATYATDPHPYGMSYAFGKLWVGNTDNGAINAFDTTTGTQVCKFIGGGGHLTLTSDLKYLYANDSVSNVIHRINPSTCTEDSGSIGLKTATAFASKTIVSDGTDLWVVQTPNQVARIDAVTGLVKANYTVGNNPYALAFDGISVWAASFDGSNVVRIRAKDGAIFDTIALPGKVIASFAQSNRIGFVYWGASYVTLINLK